jgi:hypothetical protein
MCPAKNVSSALFRINTFHSMVPSPRTLTCAWPVASDVETGSFSGANFVLSTQAAALPDAKLGRLSSAAGAGAPGSAQAAITSVSGTRRRMGASSWGVLWGDQTGGACAKPHQMGSSAVVGPAWRRSGPPRRAVALPYKLVQRPSSNSFGILGAPQHRPGADPSDAVEVPSSYSSLIAPACRRP